MLLDALKSNGFKMPDRQTRSQLAKQLHCKEITVYKWYWDEKNSHTSLDKHFANPSKRSELTARQKFELFFEESRKKVRSEMKLEGEDGQGRRLPSEELHLSVRNFC